MNCTSEIICETTGAYIRRRTWQKLRAWLWLIALALIATSVAACYDIRFLYVLLIEIFIVFPMALGPVWMSESFSPFAVRAVTPHRVEISPQGVAIKYITGEGRRPIPAEKFSWDAFTAYHDAGKCVILEWVDRHRPALRLPENAFDAAQWQTVARILAQSL